MNKQHLGPLIRQIRLAKGIAISELARMAGMADRRCNLSRYERKLKNGLRTPERLYPIAEALNTSVPALYVMQEIYTAVPLEGEELLLTLNRVGSMIKRLVPKPNSLNLKQREAA
jgi:transcriptional regulator with XRE-family HTH domain